MKSGRKTSEFFSTWMGTVLAGGFGMSSEHPMVQAAGLLAMGIAMGLYALGRGISKGKAQ